LSATTDGYSKTVKGKSTSVFAPRIEVLMGQQITRPEALLYVLDDKINAGRYLPIPLPLVGSKSSQTIWLRSGM
jgi:hypothetical protein